ncbi:MAG TPA: M56 family metallopeptidase [Vicinamibacterales bacterium]|nr:M56 family metallopeptidase [Vicinamibacterales bacterium]
MSLPLVSFARLAADHVWQSTVFAAAVWLLTLLFRRHRAAIRHGLWMAASIKFIVPFATLIALGQSIGWTRAPLPAPQVRLAVDVAAQPFSPLPSAVSLATSASSATVDNPWLEPAVERGLLVAAGCIWILGAFVLLLRWTLRWVNLRQLIASGSPIRHGREVEILGRLTDRRDAMGGSEDPPVQIVAVDSTIEPGVVGVFRPVLVWPATISARLNDEQIAAIFTHELAHVRRRDNVWAAVHMAVEAICWFHPLVWWLGGRLIDERERACDEAVLRSGREPQPYAESILRTCEFYLESPLPCVTGVTGADLKRRIETIMRNRPAETLGRARALLLSLGAVSTIAIPLSVGVLRTPRLLAQTATAADAPAFEAVSVKRNTSGDPGGLSRVQGNHYTATNITLRQLILNGYSILQSQLVAGPALATADFTNGEHFDIDATLPDGATQAQFPEMMRRLLADRFKLVAHRETREMPVYALVKARPDGQLGAALRPTTEVCAARSGDAEPGARPGGPGPGRGGPAAPGAPAALGERGDAQKTANLGIVVGGRQQAGPGCGALQFGPGQFIAHAVGIDMLVNALVNRGPITGIDRAVLDRTNLTGRYDFELKWTPPGRAGGPPPGDDPDRPSLFTALQEQLGLKLDPQRAPIEVLIVDSAAMPTEN